MNLFTSDIKLVINKYEYININIYNFIVDNYLFVRLYITIII